MRDFQRQKYSFLDALPNLLYLCKKIRIMLNTPLGRLRLIASMEGISFLLLLFIAMPLKYIAKVPEPNMFIGTAHGILFVLYVLFLIQVVIENGWNWKQAAFGFVASVVPFGTFYADAKLFKPAQHQKK